MRRLDDPQLREVLLAALTTSAGAVDAISFLALGKVFSAFMTGNLVFLGLRIGGAHGSSVVRVTCSVAAFAIGALLSALVVRSPANPERTWPSRVTAALGVAIVSQAAFLAVWVSVSGRPSSVTGDVLIALSALAMGIQTIAVFALGLRAVFTTATTATLAILMGDLSGWPQAQGERRRLVTVLIALVVGAVIGAELLDHARSWAPVFPLATTVGVVVTASAMRGSRTAGAPLESSTP